MTNFLSLYSGVELILASASPRRKELLEACGIPFSVQTSGCDETPIAGESPERMVRRLAEAKARAVAVNHPDAWVLGADTTVVCRGEIFGKPESERDAIRMLSALQGGWHEVVGGFALMHLSRQIVVVESDVTRVRMRALSAEEIRRYSNTGEPYDKAGAYAVQGIGAALVEEVYGSYTNVVGLNVSRVVQSMGKLGILGAA